LVNDRNFCGIRRTSSALKSATRPTLDQCSYFFKSQFQWDDQVLM
jgi:hypothetical protein